MRKPNNQHRSKTYIAKQFVSEYELPAPKGFVPDQVTDPTILKLNGAHSIRALYRVITFVRINYNSQIETVTIVTGWNDQNIPLMHKWMRDSQISQMVKAYSLINNTTNWTLWLKTNEEHICSKNSL